MICPNCDSIIPLEIVQPQSHWWTCPKKCTTIHSYNKKLVYYHTRCDKEDKQIMASKSLERTCVSTCETPFVQIVMELPFFLEINPETELKGLIQRLLNLKAFS